MPTNPLKVLTLESIQELDPATSALFSKHLARAALDCYDRPADKKARKVSITVEVSPSQEPDGTCDKVAFQVFVASTVPTHRTRALSLGLKPSGQLVFNPDSPANVDQGTFLTGDE